MAGDALDIMVFMEEPLITLKLNERCTRAMYDAVNYALTKWAGETDLDQEQLIALRYQLQACVFEFDFDIPSH